MESSLKLLGGWGVEGGRRAGHGAENSAAHL